MVSQEGPFTSHQVNVNGSGLNITGDAANEPSVAIADYQSEADGDAPAREREELKRLLYVALTRARHTLVLAYDKELFLDSKNSIPPIPSVT